MQGNTNRGRKKIAPVVVALVAALLLVPVICVMLAVMGLVAGEEGGALALPVLALYVVVPGAVVVGVVAAMGQRLREIDGGEEDEAKKY